jgi:hypothetical protein
VSTARVNAVGDLVLTDPAAMRALAEPGRLALLDRLRREGSVTAAELCAHGPELEELERFGFVTTTPRAGTADELRGLQDGLERLLEPFITRGSDGVPAGARTARVLAYFLPQA